MITVIDRIARGVGRFLLTDAPTNTTNPLHALTGKRLKPWISGTVSAGLLAWGGASAYANVRSAERAGYHIGTVPIPRLSADGHDSLFDLPRGGDPTLGATGDIVLGLRNIHRRY